MASVEEAALAVRLGASALGLVSAMPSGPGPIPDDLIAEIAASVPPGVATFLLTCRDDPAGVMEQVRRAGVGAVQLVDHVEPDVYAALRDHLPNVKIVQVVHVVGDASIAEAEAAAPLVDAILLDSGNPSLAVKELGGTGRRHDWLISRRIVEAVAVPVWVAGGLRADNVAEAISTVRPFGVDVCSGLRTDGRLDSEKARAFFAAVAACSTV
jgi:phosphoribosylanthranilate isomerase